MTKSNYPCVVSIAGSDPSGGAGIQADIKAISATGSYAASIITALTAQNTLGVQGIFDIPPDFISQQIHSVFSDLNVASVKIGMLHQEKIINVVEDALIKFKPKNIVIDPVMISKNGCELLKQECIELLKQKLFPFATLITPNLVEAEKIVGQKITTFHDMRVAAEKIAKDHQINVLIKGGHLNSAQSSDVLYLKESSTYFWYHAERISTKNSHGTGCSLSSAIASYLAQGYEIKDAIDRAKQYITKAIEAGSSMQIGKGCGPICHFRLSVYLP